MLPFLAPFRRRIAVIMLAVPVVAFLQGVQPYLLKMAVDRYVGDGGQAWISLPTWAYPTIMVGILLLLGLLEVWQNFTVQSIGMRFVSDIRDKLFCHLQKLSIDFFETTQTGKLLTRLTNDLEALSETFANGIVGGANDLFSLAGIVGFMLFIDWRLALVPLSLVPLLVLSTRIFQSVYRRANASSRHHLSALNGLFQESLSGLPVVKMFGREGFLGSKFGEVNGRYIRANNTFIAADSAFSAFIELVSIWGIALLLLIGGLLASQITPGKLVAFVSYSQLLFTPIRSLSEKFSVFQSGFTALERIVGLLDYQPTVRSGEPVQTLPKPARVVCEGVSFKYAREDRDMVLKDVSFSLEQGQSLGIVGRTGSGKSTLIKLLCRFYDPVEGRITIGGRDLRDIEPRSLRRQVLSVPQRSFLFSGSIRDNLCLDKSLSEQELRAAAGQTGLDRLLDSMPHGLDTALRQDGVELSTGQKQLISLTRALLQDSSVLIMDEATANLDPFTEALITDATAKLLSSGRTVIFIAHRLHLVRECDQIMVLSQGRIEEMGGHQDLMARDGLYAHLHSLSSVI